jgi:4-alpha-glucanotransferase
MDSGALHDRSSGLLLHLSSLPGPYGCGDLGGSARAFADFLGRAGQRWWQMLPVGPAGFGDSPYSALSAFAGNPLFVDLDALGIQVSPSPPELAGATDAVDYAGAVRFRERHLRHAMERLDGRSRARFEAFAEREARWLDDFALFDALKRAHGGRAWIAWHEDVRDRKPGALDRARKDLAEDVLFAKRVQWLFDEHWTSFREHCRNSGVGLIGDLPIFVAHDSADVWQHRELFDLDATGRQRHVAGVPPDYFSATGQRWGNPLYRWKVLARSGYRWWVDRVRAALSRFDVVRLDHFIGFVRYWQIPASEPTAIGGRWVRGPGKALFDAVAKDLAIETTTSLPFIAEDLGVVTPRVTRLRRELGLPGIALLQFAFGTDPRADHFLPYNYGRGTAVYTGTHDNDTALGWYTDPGGTSTSTRTREEADRERSHVRAYLGKMEHENIDIAAELVRAAMASVARTCIVPMQDVLGLGTEARMNRPGVAEGNWRWRVRQSALGDDVAGRLYQLSTTYGRNRRNPT